jgi:hypothetical protein
MAFRILPLGVKLKKPTVESPARTPLRLPPMGTKVTNPVRREGQPGFMDCPHCGKTYTRFGITKHMNMCAAAPKKRKRAKK